MTKGRTRRTQPSSLDIDLPAELEQVIAALRAELKRGRRPRAELFAWGQDEYERLLRERMRRIVEAVTRPGSAGAAPLVVPFHMRRPLPGFQALMVRVPEARRTIVLLSNWRTMAWRFDDFAIAIGRILDELPYLMPRRSVRRQSQGR